MRSGLDEHQFRLILEGPDFDDLPESAWDRLYESGCDDATIGSSGGVWTAAFQRQAPTLAEAIASAIRSIEAAGVGLRALRVEAEADDPDISRGEAALRADVIDYVNTRLRLRSLADRLGPVRELFDQAVEVASP